MDSKSKPSSSKRSAESKGNAVKRQKLEDEKPFIFQLFASKLSDHRRLHPLKLDENSNQFSNHSSPTQHSWVLPMGFKVQRFSPDGRLVYILQRTSLIIIDLLLNTHAVLKEPEHYSTRLNTYDFVVLNSTTVLSLGFPWKTGNSELQLIRFFVEERRFERQLLHIWRNVEVSIVLTNITGGSTDRSSAVLQRGIRWQVGRLDLDKMEFTLNSTVIPRYNSARPCYLSEDGLLFHLISHTDELQVFDLKTQEMSRRKLPEFVKNSDDYRSYCSLTKKFLYLERKTREDQEPTKWSLWRLDLETDEWTKLPFETTNKPIRQVMPIVDEKGDDRGLMISTALELKGTTDVRLFQYFAYRVIFGAPESLVKLCWLKFQDYFSQCEGPNNFDELRKKKPFSTIFPEVYKSMVPFK